MESLPGNKILVYRLGSLGDTIMCLPCLHLVRKLFPGKDITLLTNQSTGPRAAQAEQILGSDGYFFNHVLHYPVGTRDLVTLWRIIKRIREQGIDTAIHLTAARSSWTVFRDRIFFWLAGIKHQYAFPRKKEDFQVLVDPETGKYEWEAKRLARRMIDLGPVNLNDPGSWDLRISEWEKRSALQMAGIDHHDSVVTVSIGTKVQSKDWGLENWKATIRGMSSLLNNRKLIFIGSADEAEESELCLREWNGEGVNLCGRVSVRESAAILKMSTFFIGHDSGPMHLAGSAGIPCIAVFSARSLPEQWFPAGTHNRIIYHRTDCAGCHLEVCIEQKKKCILSISPEEVLNAVKELMGEYPDRRKTYTQGGEIV